MKNVLITGSLGFIGQSLLNSLKETNYKTYECNRLNGDLTLENTWKDIIYFKGVNTGARY